MVVETLSAQAEVPGQQGRIRMDSWPALVPGDETASTNNQNPNSQAQDDPDWGEFIDNPEDDEDIAEEKVAKRRVMFNPKVLYRCASTPDFGNYDDEPNPFDTPDDAATDDNQEEGVDQNKAPDADASESKGESKDGEAAPEAAGGPSPPATTKPKASIWGPPTTAGGKPGTPTRRPSFADMLLANASARKEAEDAAARHRAETAALLKKERDEHRKARGLKTRLVVTPIKRCAKSTGNLRALDHIQEHHEDEDDGGYGGGGGGGGGGMPSIDSNEVLGDTDAMDFYHRKQKGAQNRVAGEKIRPDELKRKEISQYKRDAQRKAQQERQGGGGGKGGGGSVGGKNKAKAERQAAAASNKGKGGKGRKN